MKKSGIGWLGCAVVVALAWCARAEQKFPAADWKEKPNPLASPDAQPGGEMIFFLGQYPDSFNYLLDTSYSAGQIFASLFESLLTMNPITLDYEPWIAESWTLSDDRRTFTFRIAERARWSDGRPITAADVRWTYDAIMNPTNLTGPHKVDMERFEPPEALDERTIRFRAKEAHWQNLGAVGDLMILPRHAFEGRDFNKVNFDFPVVSGQYRIAEYKEGLFVRLARRDDWWNRDAVRVKGTGNFASIRYRFFAEQENALEAFLKGDMDIFPVYMAKQWISDATGKRFNQNWIVKQKIVNHRPIGFQGFAMNMRRAPFDDARVRLAMAHLCDRNKMNRTLMYDQYLMLRSYFEDLYDKANPCPNPAIAFDKAEARRLLAEAGWKANPRTGILEKDGKLLVVRFLTRDVSSDKFLSIYREDLRDVGIQLEVDRKDWAGWKKDMDEFNYQMTWAAWGAGVFKNPEYMWHSREADRPSGNNITGFKSPEVDALIEKQKTIFNVAERHEICRQIDRRLVEATPYVLLWYINYTRVLYWNKFGVPPTVLSRYSAESSATGLWWYDEDSAADLADAIKKDSPLPPRPAVVDFDAAFSGARPVTPESAPSSK